MSNKLKDEKHPVLKGKDNMKNTKEFVNINFVAALITEDDDIVGFENMYEISEEEEFQFNLTQCWNGDCIWGQDGGCYPNNINYEQCFVL